MMMERTYRAEEYIRRTRRMRAQRREAMLQRAGLAALVVSLAALIAALL